MNRTCEVCHDPLTFGEQLRGLFRRELVQCRFLTLTGVMDERSARWVCGGCLQQERRHPPRGTR